MQKRLEVVAPICLTERDKIANIERNSFEFKKALAHSPKLFAIASCVGESKSGMQPGYRPSLIELTLAHYK